MSLVNRLSGLASGMMFARGRRGDGPRRPRAQFLLETLEARTVLTATLNGSVLEIVGTDPGEYSATATGNDQIFVYVDADGNVQSKINGESNPGFALAGITRIEITGGGGDDVINIGSNIQEAAGIDVGVYLGGGQGDDTLTGGEGRDVIIGGPGNDRLLGNGGDDALIGGAGDDNLGGGQGNDILLGGSGNDVMVGGAGNDILTGDGGSDRIVGNEDDDLIIAGTTVWTQDDNNTNLTPMVQIRREWSRNASAAERAARIRGTEAGGLNAEQGNFFLVANDTVLDDNVTDIIMTDAYSNNNGGATAGVDWVLANFTAGDSGKDTLWSKLTAEEQALIDQLS